MRLLRYPLSAWPRRATALFVVIFEGLGMFKGCHGLFC